MMTETPKNIDALLYQLEAEMAVSKTADGARDEILLHSYFNRVRGLRNERIGKMQERLETDNMKQSLKIKISELSLFRVIKEMEGKIKSIVSRLLTSLKEKERETSRCLEAAQEVDKSKTGILSNNTSDSSQTLGTHGSAALNQAMGASVCQMYESQRLNEKQQSIQQTQQANAIENQKSQVQKQLDLLKKSKIFGIFIAVLSVIVQTIPAVGVYMAQGAKFLGEVAKLLLQNSMANHQLYEQNSAQEVQQIIKNILEQDQGLKKSQSNEEQIVSNLESSHGSTLWK